MKSHQVYTFTLVMWSGWNRIELNYNPQWKAADEYLAQLDSKQDHRARLNMTNDTLFGERCHYLSPRLSSIIMLLRMICNNNKG